MMSFKKEGEKKAKKQKKTKKPVVNGSYLLAFGCRNGT